MVKISNEEKEKIKELLKNFRRIRSKIQIGNVIENPKHKEGSGGIAKVGSSKPGRGSKFESESAEYIDNDKELDKLEKVRKIIFTAYNELPESEKEIVQLKFFEENTYGEVGDMLSVPVAESTVRRRLKNVILPRLKGYGILKAWNFYDRKDELEDK